LVEHPAFARLFELTDKGDELVCDQAERNFSDIELMARDQLQEQVKGAIKVGEVDVKSLIGGAFYRVLPCDWRCINEIFHERTVTPYLQNAAHYA
jgi:hypothetical protein